MVDRDLGERVRRFTYPGIDKVTRLIREAEEFYKQALDYANPLLEEFKRGVPEGRRAKENYFFYTLVQGLRAVFLTGRAIYRQNEVQLRKYEEVLRILREHGAKIDGFMEYVRPRQDNKQ